MSGSDTPARHRSTISARLSLLLLVPLTGMMLFGVLAGLDERSAALEARDLGREAKLVELLSAASVELDVQADSIAGLQEVGALGIDLGEITPLLGYTGVEDITGYRDVDVTLARIAALPTELWANPEAVEQLLATWPELSAISEAPDIDSPGFEAVRSRMATAVGDALAAQTQRLNTASGRLELGPELAATARSREPSLSLLAAALDERRALSEYVLPLTDRPVEESYRRLVTAASHYDYVLADLRAGLSDEHRLQLDAALSTEASLAYQELLTQAVQREIAPSIDLSNPLASLPTGMIVFANGFERIRGLLAFDRQLSADFTAGALALESEADERLRLAILVGAGFAALTIVANIIAIRSITKPVRALLHRARRITEGDLTTIGPRSGPSDIGLVHQALDEMSANLRTLSEQAEALSDGRLDDEVLTRNVVGQLGASVHGSVARLRSMTARLEHEATHDSLTKLPNRAAVMSLLDRCLTGSEHERSPLAAIMLDLDGFKQANDDMGHAIGDEVLVNVANRLRAKSEGEFVARLGGDEFMIVIAGADAVTKAEGIATTAIDAIGDAMSVSSGTIRLSASAGIADTAAPEWLSPSEVLRRVDLALYEAKVESATVVRFDQRLHDSLLETAQLQGEIRLALDREEFSLELQPIVATSERMVVGYEALIRWASPLRGKVAPGLFIPVAEQSQLIDQIDAWVINRGAEILQGWQPDPHLAELSLAVNISARHLSNPNLVSTVEAALAATGVPPGRLMLEVTESQLIPNLVRAEDNLRVLRSLGVRLAIDDFGTGYASIAHLRRVRFDRLKIDQSFLAHLDDETDRSLASLLVSLGRDLDLEVVAEGIETETQLMWATDAGCTHAQGYLLGRPSPSIKPRPVHRPGERRGR